MDPELAGLALDAFLLLGLGLGEEVVDVGRVRRKASRPSVSELKPS